MECRQWEIPDDDDNRRRLEDAEEEEVQYFIGPYCASQEEPSTLECSPTKHVQLPMILTMELTFTRPSQEPKFPTPLLHWLNLTANLVSMNSTIKMNVNSITSTWTPTVTMLPTSVLNHTCLPPNANSTLAELTTQITTDV
eukprot:74927_1